MPADPGAPPERDADFSWASPQAPADAARQDEAERRRERRRRWVRPHSLTVVVVVALVDAVVFTVVSAWLGVTRQDAGRPCATFWADLAHDASVDLRVVVVILVATLLLCVRRRWIFVAALVVQVVVGAVLLPTIVQDRAGFTAVAEGRISPADAPSVSLGCDSR